MLDLRILVVDDEPGVRYFLRETLSEIGGLIVLAEDGKKALDLIKEETFDAAVLDLKMDRVGGLAVLEALHQQSPAPVAIVLTAYGSMETAIEALRNGAYDYLLKPCDPEILRTSLRAGLEMRQRMQDQQVSAKFVSDVSHELRSPITSIGLWLQLLENCEPEKFAIYLNNLKQATAQAELIIEGTLALAHLGQSGSGLDFAATSLNEMVLQISSAALVRAEAAGLDLNFELGEGLPPVWAVGNLLIQVIVNLINNALSYTFSGSVHVRTYFDPDQNIGKNGLCDCVCLEIQDTGIGITDEDKLYLFERFYRGRRVKSLGVPGNGLGLAIVKEIVDLHNGKISLESRVDVGSTFRVWLPLAADNESVGERQDSKLRTER